MNEIDSSNVSTRQRRKPLRVDLARILFWELRGKAVKKGLRRLNWILNLREMGCLSCDSIALQMRKLNLRQSIIEAPAYIQFLTWQLYADKTQNYIDIREYLYWALGIKPYSDECDRVILMLSEWLWLDEYGFDDPVLRQTERWKDIERFMI